MILNLMFWLHGIAEEYQVASLFLINGESTAPINLIRVYWGRLLIRIKLPSALESLSLNERHVLGVPGAADATSVLTQIDQLLP